MKFYKNKIIDLIKKLTPYLLFLKRKDIDVSEVQKILINSLYFRGDTIFHIPVFQALRYLFPNAQIDLWVKSRNYEIVKNNPCFSNIIVFDHFKTADYNEKVNLELNNKINFIKSIRKNRYDLYIDLTGKYSTGILALLGRFKYSAGINYHGFGFCYNKYYELDTSHIEGHLIDKYLSVIKNIFDINDTDWNNLLKVIRSIPYLYTDAETKQMVDEELRRRNITKDKPLICLHTTAGWKAKEMDSDKFASLIKNLAKSGKYHILIVGDKSDMKKLAEIQSFLGSSFNINNMFLSLPLNGTIELINRADLLIGSDSAPLQIAGVVNTSSIALFGPTNPEFIRPRGKNHLVVYHELYCSASKNEQFCTRNAGKTCATIDCMKNIAVKEIMEKIDFLLKNETTLFNKTSN